LSLTTTQAYIVSADTKGEPTTPSKDRNHRDGQPADLDLICMGRIGIDLYSGEPGRELEYVATFHRYPGGTPGNVAIGAARLGLDVALFSRVGHDPLGTYLESTLRQEGVGTLLLRKDRHHLTGLVIIEVKPPESRTCLFYRENCADSQMRREDIDEDALARSKALLVTGTALSQEPICATTHHAVSVARNKKTKVVLDIDYRPVLWDLTGKADGSNRYVDSPRVTSELSKIIDKADLIVGTEDEIRIAGGTRDVDKSLSGIREKTDAVVVVKHGDAGCTVYQRGHAPIASLPFRTEVVDQLGAGDAFLAGFLFRWLRDGPYEECAMYGNANAALKVTRHGCALAMPTHEELLEFLTRYNRRG